MTILKRFFVNEKLKRFSFCCLTNSHCVEPNQNLQTGAKQKKKCFMIYVTEKKAKQKLIFLSSSPRGNEESSGERRKLMYCKSASSCLL